MVDFTSNVKTHQKFNFPLGRLRANCEISFVNPYREFHCTHRAFVISAHSYTTILWILVRHILYYIYIKISSSKIRFKTKIVNLPLLRILVLGQRVALLLVAVRAENARRVFQAG